MLIKQSNKIISVSSEDSAQNGRGRCNGGREWEILRENGLGKCRLS